MQQCPCWESETCDACLKLIVSQLAGVASNWGGTWANEIARRDPRLLERQWPARDEVVRGQTVIAMASARVAKTGVTKDRRQLEALGEFAYEGAQEEWERLRAARGDGRA